MPGPGGGSRGGGFGGRGGGFGGGFGPRRPHYHFGWGFRPRYYGGGGCLGGLLGMIMLPVIMLIFAGFFLMVFIGSAFTNVANGGTVRYDEATFQKYADMRYAEEFGTSTAYEDNLLLVFLTNEDTSEYYAIAWVGNNIRSEISDMFGNEYTEFGRTVSNAIPEYYEYSLSSNLASVMEKMTESIDKKLDLDTSFRVQTPHTVVTQSHITNYTELNISAETVNASLVAFTEATDIPTVIVVDTMENVFGKSIDVFDFFIVVVMLIIAGVSIYMIVKAVRENKNNKNNDKGNGGNYNRNSDTRNDQGRYSGDYH